LVFSTKDRTISLGDFVIKVIRIREGLSEQQLLRIATAVKDHSEKNTRIRNFGTMAGILELGNQYAVSCIARFVLTRLFDSWKDVADCLESADGQYICGDRARNIVNALFEECDEWNLEFTRADCDLMNILKPWDPSSKTKCIVSVDKLLLPMTSVFKSKLKGKCRKSIYVMDFDDFLEAILGAWIREWTRTRSLMLQHRKALQESYNQELDRRNQLIIRANGRQYNSIEIDELVKAVEKVMAENQLERMPESASDALWAETVWQDVQGTIFNRSVDSLLET